MNILVKIRSKIDEGLCFLVSFFKISLTKQFNYNIVNYLPSPISCIFEKFNIF